MKKKGSILNEVGNKGSESTRYGVVWIRGGPYMGICSMH